MKNVPGLYQHYHSERNDERLELFEIVRAEYGTDSFLYPGCFVHVTPAFVMPNATFVDADKRAKRFFDDPQTLSFVRESRRYRERADLQFLWRDYTDELPIHRGYDLLISQYAGFVSESCKRYLRKGGVLLANNSHGDASLASIDEDFRLIAVIQRRGEHFWVSTSRLDEYFVPAKQVEVTRQLLHATKRGIGYKRSASDYVFEKLSSHAVAALSMKTQARTGSVLKRRSARRAETANDHGGDTEVRGNMALGLTAWGLLKRTDALPTR